MEKTKFLVTDKNGRHASVEHGSTEKDAREAWAKRYRLRAGGGKATSLNPARAKRDKATIDTTVTATEEAGK